MTRIVMTTNDNEFGRLILDELHARDIKPDAVLVMLGGFGPIGIPAKKGRPPRPFIVRWPRAVAGSLRRRFRFHRSRRAWYDERCGRVIVTGHMGTRLLLRDLDRADPDYLLLGGGGVLTARFIDTARSGVLNTHPGLLPWMRGSAIIGHALEQDVALGAAVHFVNEGIDTGPLILQRLLPITPGPDSLEDLERRGEALAARMVAEVLEAVIRGERPVGVPQVEKLPINLWPPASQRDAQRALAESGRAAELFERWRPLSSGEDFTLPAGPFERPDK